MVNSVDNEIKRKELMNELKEINKKYPYFQNPITDFFHAFPPQPNQTLNTTVKMNLGILKAELSKVIPLNVNSLLQYFDFKIPNLKELDNERLGFLDTKHRDVIEIYNYIIKINHIVENHYNLILKDISNIQGERQFIKNVATVHINLNLSIKILIESIENLIKENDLVREDFRLVTLPENTFNKTKFYWRPIFGYLDGLPKNYFL
jgi:hypothetical protein